VLLCWLSLNMIPVMAVCVYVLIFWPRDTQTPRKQISTIFTSMLAISNRASLRCMRVCGVGGWSVAAVCGARWRLWKGTGFWGLDLWSGEVNFWKGELETLASTVCRERWVVFSEG
jgi:hypothetical protein